MFPPKRIPSFPTYQEWKIILGMRIPTYLLKSPEMLSFVLMINMASMITVSRRIGSMMMGAIHRKSS